MSPCEDAPFPLFCPGCGITLTQKIDALYVGYMTADGRLGVVPTCLQPDGRIIDRFSAGNFIQAECGTCGRVLRIGTEHPGYPAAKEDRGDKVPVSVTVRFDILVPAGTDIDGIYIDVPLDTPTFLDGAGNVVAEGATEFTTERVERGGD
jgi:hypothetical protein